MTAPVVVAAARSPLLIAVVAFLVGGGGGMALEYKILVKPAPVETAQPAVRQQDSSLVLARAPDAKAKPKQLVPKGAVVERIEHIEVQPNATQPAVSIVESVHGADSVQHPANSSVPTKQKVLCPPVGVDLTLLRLKDGTHRVVASSPDGAILVSSVDIPVENVAPTKVLKWSAGPAFGSSARYGVHLARDLGPSNVWVAGVTGAKGGVFMGGVGLRF